MHRSAVDARSALHVASAARARESRVTNRWTVECAFWQYTRRCDALEDSVRIPYFIILSLFLHVIYVYNIILFFVLCLAFFNVTLALLKSVQISRRELTFVRKMSNFLISLASKWMRKWSSETLLLPSSLYPERVCYLSLHSDLFVPSNVFLSFTELVKYSIISCRRVIFSLLQSSYT